MAKKKFGVSSTLNKNNKVEDPALPPKRPLIRSKKNIDAVKEKVDAIHQVGNEGTSPKPPQKTQTEVNSVEEPTIEISIKDEDVTDTSKNTQSIVEENEKNATTKRKYTKKQSTPPKPERIVRITVDTPRSMHVKLKIKAIENDITIRDYVIGLIKADLGM